MQVRVVVMVDGTGVCLCVCVEVREGVLDLKFTPNHSESPQGPH